MEKINQLTNCIYCDKQSDNLTDEHVIPLGLGGTNILKSSSCLSCNEITSKFENFILRGHWLGIRKKLNTGSRRKNRPFAPLKVNLIKPDGTKIPGTVPVEECTFQLIFSLFEPEILATEIQGGIKPYAKGIGMMTIGAGGPTILTESDGRKRRILGGEKIEYLLHEFTAENFFRFLAKVAHSFAIKERGINVCKTYFLREIILGNTKDAMKYIGNASYLAQGIRLKRIDRFHSLELLEVNQYLTVLVQLFNVANHDVQPIYQVVVGEIQ
jgi:hypothetical protein